MTFNGKFALWAGNTNVNASVVFSGQSNDKDSIFTLIDGAPLNFVRFQSFVYPGYWNEDVDMNGNAIFAGQNNDVDPIFNNVDGHPVNIFKLQTFNIPQQLPQ